MEVRIEMITPSISEFAPYRFVRDGQGNVITLPSPYSEEQILLVLDGERWGIARLHIFEGAAVHGGQSIAFEDAFQAISDLRNNHLTRIFSWGRQDDDLFYVDEMLDGEPLPDYLIRTGRLPFALAAQWVLSLLEFFETVEVCPPSLERFSSSDFAVVMCRRGQIRLVFSSICGWIKPGPVSDHPVEKNLARIFCSLISGESYGIFGRNSLPENWDELDIETREVLLKTLEVGGVDTYRAFKAVMLAGAAGAKDHPSNAAIPIMPIREWFRSDLKDFCNGVPDFTLDSGLECGEERYAIHTHRRGKRTRIQIIPGPGSIPRDGWLNQHHEATRRPGVGMVNQLQVTYIEDCGSLTMIGEEHVEGVDLSTLVHVGGALSHAAVKNTATAVHAALDGLERQAGSCAVWCLPPENIILLTGTRSPGESLRLIEREGAGAWSDLPLKLRLHQTLETLLDGVDLPSPVRHLSSLAGKQHEELRRSAIALPLLWFLLTGLRFNWERPVLPLTEFPRGLGEIFERFRKQIRKEPSEVEENFFCVFERFIPEFRDEELPLDEEEAEEMLEGSEEGCNTYLHGVYDDELDFAGKTEVQAGEENGEPAEMGIQALSERSTFPVWHWALVLGVVVASCVGVSLSEWSFQKGIFEETSDLKFILPDFEFSDADTAESALSELGDLLISDASPKSLALLALLGRMDIASHRGKIVRRLNDLAENGNGGADRVLGLLARSRGESRERVAGHFLQGAKRGDRGARIRYAAMQWAGEPGASLGGDALEFLEMAASSGDPAAQELLSLANNAAKDANAAFIWMEKSARGGRVSALYQLGVFYANGTGCELNVSQAAEYFRAAAERGDERAMFDYARCLAVGYGVETYYPAAERWMRIASSRGHGAALRWCLAREIEVP